MCDELEMRRAEVDALRAYRKQTVNAVETLANTLRLLRLDSTVTQREKDAINFLLENHDDNTGKY